MRYVTEVRNGKMGFVRYRRKRVFLLVVPYNNMGTFKRTDKVSQEDIYYPANKMTPDNIKVRLPDQYDPEDFSDDIKALLKDSLPEVNDGRISMRVFFKETLIERFDKMFRIELVAFFGQISITIQEV